SALRLSGDRHWHNAHLFRQRPVGGDRAGAQAHRRRDADPPPHPDGLRARRERRRRSRAEAPDDVRDRRRWPDGCRACRRDRRAGAQGAGRRVPPDLTVPRHPDVFVIGDTAALVQDGKPLPGIAPAAKQGGIYAAKVIRATVLGRPKPPPFRYRHYGALATIGRNSAVIDFGRIRMKGRLAWLIWSMTHIYFLIGGRNRLLVTLQWLFDYITFSRGARLIAGS